MHYSNFPVAPTSVVSGLSAVCAIPSIVDARVGADGTLYLDVYQDEAWQLTSDHVRAIAEFCETDAADVVVGQHETPGLVWVAIARTPWDFALQQALQAAGVAP